MVERKVFGLIKKQKKVANGRRKKGSQLEEEKV